MNPKLSIIVPLYNEMERLKPGFDTILEFINNRSDPCEVIYVDDGSADQTAPTVRDLIGDDSRMRLVSYSVNRGKGHAVKVGMLEAKGDVRLFTDIDLSVPIRWADDFLTQINAGNDVVIGTRRIASSSVLVHQPRYREVLGEIFRRFAQMVFAPGISDFTCGFKAFTAQAAQKVFSKSRIPRWSFDAEILFLASRWGCNIHEIPVEWTNSPSSKVNLAVDVGRSLYELILIRLYWHTGKYGKP